MDIEMVKEHTLTLMETSMKGEWKSGKKHGQGTFTLSNGGKYVGEWKDGEIWKGTHFDKDGNIIGKWWNGVKQK